jgi:hypothetical protein
LLPGQYAVSSFFSTTHSFPAMGFYPATGQKK